MADQVQFILDRMTSTLRSAEQIGIFSHAEVQSIVRKRTDFEYVLKRRQLTPNDFVVYLQYELNLERLRELRSQKFEEGSLAREEKDAIRNVKSCFARHVIYIFDRALRRFASETSIWADYIDYLKKSNSNAALNTALGRAIALFPNNENMWIEAAAHELNNNNSAEAARKLLQRALRVNKTSRPLWKRYFELELWNVARISNRKKILKIEEDEAVRERLRAVSAPLVVFRYAVAAIPEAEFAYELYDLAIAVSEEVGDSILSEMKKTLGHLSSLWAHLAVALVGKQLRALSQPSEDAAPEGAAPSTLLDKFADVTSIVMTGMEVLESGLDAFAVGSGAAAPPAEASEPAAKRRKSKKAASEAEAQDSVTSISAAQCTEEDINRFLEAFAKAMQVCIGAVSSIYTDALAGGSGSFDQITAAFKVLDIGLQAAKRVMFRLVNGCASHATVATSHISSLLVLCRFRLGVLLQFADFFSGKWFAALNNADEGSKSKKRKSTAVKLAEREPLVDGVVDMSIAGVVSWLEETASAQVALCAKAGGAPCEVVSHCWVRVASAALNYLSVAEEQCQGLDSSGGVDTNHPGNFWWSLIPADAQSDWLAGKLDDLSKAVCSAVGVNFAEAANADGKDSVVSVMTKAQSVLLRNSSLSVSCQRKAFVSSSLQSAIRSKYVTAEMRMHWICEHIKLAYGSFSNMVSVVSDENTKAGRAAYRWCEQVLHSMPGILFLHSKGSASGSSMAMMYDQVFEMEELNEFLADCKKVNGRKRAADAAKIQFLNTVFESALRACEDDESILEQSAEYYGATGNHKRANHLRWRKNNTAALKQ